MKLTLEAVDLPSLKFQLIEVCQSLGIPLATHDEASAAPTLAPAPELSALDPPKKTRAKKTPPSAHLEGEPDQEPTTLQSEVVPAAALNPYPKEAVFASLKKVSSIKGMVVAKKVLDQFKCARISELKEEQYAEFIKVCDQLSSTV